MVTGLVIMEMLKIVQDKPVESYRNAFCNLALPLFTLSEPKPCDTVKNTSKIISFNRMFKNKKKIQE